MDGCFLFICVEPAKTTKNGKSKISNNLSPFKVFPQYPTYKSNLVASHPLTMVRYSASFYNII